MAAEAQSPAPFTPAQSAPPSAGSDVLADVTIPENFLINPTPLSPAPVISLKRISRINTYEVMEVELEDLDKATSAENQALGFTTFCFGALLSTILGWIGLKDPTAIAVAVYLSSTLVLILASLHFAFTWHRERRTRVRLLEKIRSQTLPLLP